MILTSVSAVAQPSRPLPDQDIRAVVADVLSGSGYQRELPDTEPPAPEAAPQSRPRAEGGATIPAAVFYVFVAVVVLAIGVYIANETPFLLRRWRRGAGEGPAALAFATGGGGPAGPAGLDKADALAAAGDHTGAVRLLLLTVFDTIAARAGDAIPPALTSREVVHRAGLTGAGRTDVLAILTAEEESYFGGYAIDRAAYDRCRRHFLSFAQGGVAHGATA